jgi:hypothetical protein
MAYIIFSIKTRDYTEHNKIGTNSFRSTKLQLCIFESALKSVKKRKRKNKNPILLGYWVGPVKPRSPRSSPAHAR